MSIDRKAAVIAAIKHQQTSYCPYTFSWEGDVGDHLDVYYGSRAWRDRFREYIVSVAKIDDKRQTAEPGQSVTRDLYGSTWRVDRRPVHLEEPVLKEPSLRGYHFPDPEQLFPDELYNGALKTIAEYRDCFTVGRISFGLFERSWALRGFENVLVDAVAEPAFFADLIAAITEHQSHVLERLLELPFDGFYFGDDWGDQRGIIIGPDRWRDTIKPNYARLYAQIKAAGRFVLTHCCGSLVDSIPDAIEIGLDVLESVQPEARGMNPYELKDRFGDKLTFWGGLGSQSIIPFGTPDELRSEIRKLADHMKKGGGYILAPSKPLQPETPTENAVAILEEFIALGEQA
jgi:uroporphyrinogen decarboxylase